MRPRAAPRAPRSVALPLPRPPSETVRPPREALEAVAGCSVLAAGGADSLALGREGFFALDTSPHCEIVPVEESRNVSIQPIGIDIS